MIEVCLNRQSADALFAEHAVFMCGCDVIFDYKIAELFGAECCAWAESCMCLGGELLNDFNMFGPSCSFYFYKSGFDKIVTWHNNHISNSEYKASPGGLVWGRLWSARRERIAAQDAEDARKREERRQKRAAARKAKQEAQQIQPATEE